MAPMRALTSPMHRSLLVCAPFALIALALSACGGAAMYDQKEPPPHGGGFGDATQPAPTATAIAAAPDAPSFMRVGEIAPAPIPPAAPIVAATAAPTGAPAGGPPKLPKDTNTKNFSTAQNPAERKPESESLGGSSGGEAATGNPTKTPEPVRGAVVDSTSGLTEAEVRLAIVGRQASFRECYDLGGANFSGSVSLRVSIGPTGTVASVDVVASSTKSTNVDSCVASAVRRIQFPAKGAGAVVAFPIEFGR